MTTTRITVGGLIALLTLGGFVASWRASLADDVRGHLATERVISDQAYAPRDAWHETRGDLQALTAVVQALTAEVERMRASVEELSRRLPQRGR